VLGFVNQCSGQFYAPGIRRKDLARIRVFVSRIGPAVCNILGQLYMHCARSFRLGQPEGVTHYGGDSARIYDRDGFLGDSSHHFYNIDELETWPAGSL